MGANQSYESNFADVIEGSHVGKDRGQDEGSLQKRRKKAKPASPHRPVITSVTHNAISMTWLPPRHSLHAIIAYTVEIRKSQQAKSWTTLTKNCQGTHYEARHLDSDAEYVFRVRAENIFGTGKPSAPSSPVTTKIFESSSDLNCYLSHSHSFTTTSPISPYIERRPTTPSTTNVPKSISYDTGLLDHSDFETSTDSGMVKSPSLQMESPNSSFGTLSSSNLSINQNQNFRRRHSFNVHFDGRISTMLNHSDRFYSTNSLNSSTSTIVVNKPKGSAATASTSNIYNNNTNSNNDTDNTKKRRSNSTSTLRNNNTHRSSLHHPPQPYRKSSIPILLPGTGSNSLNKLRESRASLKSSSNDISGSGSASGSTSSNTTLTNINTTTTTPRHRGSLNLNHRKSRECRNSLGSTASDSNTTTSSASSSSTKDDYPGGKMSEGSRLSLQSVFSDVTMSTHSQTSSDDSSPSRPISFSDIGENSELALFLNGSSFIDALKTSTTSSAEEENRNALDNENDDNSPNKNSDDYYENRLNDEIDDIYKLKHDLKNMEITEEKLKFHDLKERLKIGGVSSSEDSSCLTLNDNAVNQRDYYQTLDNPWEKDTDSVNRVSENIMAAPYSDDIKIALNAKNYGSDDVNANGGYPYHQNHHSYFNHHRFGNQSWGSHGNEGGDCHDDGLQESRDDFRTLRSVLQSNNMIVKQSRSMPEVVGVVLGEGGETRTLTRGKLTTIEDEDEEEETVRVTTL